MREGRSQTREVLLHDGTAPCPYLRGQTARLPWRLPLRPLTRPELSQRLADGDRRQGMLLYRPACPACNACQAIRLDVGEFRPNRTQRRVLRRGTQELRTQIARPTLSLEKVRLYNRHKVERGLLVGQELVDQTSYEEFLVDTCAETLELSYRLGGRLIGVAVTDRAADALSAVYCFYDPDYAWLSPGTFSILTQVELCRTWGLRHLYLGLYVAGCAAMAYKARFRPHERLIGGRWVTFDAEVGQDEVATDPTASHQS